MDAGKVLELVHGRLVTRDAELVLELAASRNTNTELVCLNLLFGEVIEGVRAAGVGPHIREGDLLRCALLEEELAVGGAEDKAREGTMEKTLVNVLHQVACPKVQL